MRWIRRIIVHCSETQEGVRHSLDDIKHLNEEKGLNGIAYHYIIDIDGTIHKGLDEDEIGYHCFGFNTSSIGICYVGGIDKWGEPKDTRTDEQKTSLTKLIKKLKTKYTRAKVHGHNNFSHFSCPNFNARKEYKDL